MPVPRASWSRGTGPNTKGITTVADKAQVKNRESGEIVDVSTLLPCWECKADGEPWEIDCD